MGAPDRATEVATDADLPAVVVEDLLSSPRRRCLLAVLDERGEAVVADLCALVRARERDEDVADVDRAERRAVRDDLFAAHIPKLTATGVVEYDSKVGTVTLAAPEIAAVARRSLEE